MFPARSTPYKIIKPSDRSFLPDLRELSAYKDLFYTLTWRDFRVRYAQTSIGLAWALLQPLLTLLILSLVFGTFVGVKTTVPHLVFTVAGTSIWTYFSYVMTHAGNSIIGSQEMVKKIYFPRLIIPLSKAMTGFIDLGISLLIMIVLMIWYGILPSHNAWMAPFFILAGIIAALGAGIWLSALTVKFRDFQHVVPFIVQLGLYVTPIAYPAEFALSQLPGWLRPFYFLNPVAGVVQGFRWCIFGGAAPDPMIWISFATAAALFVSSLWYFNKVEKQIADYV